MFRTVVPNTEPRQFLSIPTQPHSPPGIDRLELIGYSISQLVRAEYEILGTPLYTSPDSQTTTPEY